MTPVVFPHLKYMIAIAALFSHYEIPEGSPEVWRVSEKEMRVLGCPFAKEKESCNVVGLYAHDVIYLSDSLQHPDDEEGSQNSYLIHEIVHWLQDHSGRFGKGNCDSHRVKEYEAYRTQNRYIEEIEGREFVVSMPQMTCPEGS